MTPSTILLAFFILLTPSFAQTIYATEFEEFTAGDDALVGDGGWTIGASPGTGSHGIDYEIVSGLNHSAYLGFKRPSTTLVTIAKQHSYDPVVEGKPIINFESLLGIEDSDNGQRDTFSIIFLNSTGDLLASILLRNNDSVFGIWYSDGVTIRDTGLDFTRGELQLLTAQINFQANTWSAQFDGLELFTDVTFHADDKPLNLGFTGAQWDLTSLSTFGFGNNFLLIADWVVRSVPVDDFQITSISHSVTTDTITFPSEPGFIYTLKASQDLSDWSLPVPNNVLNSPSTIGESTFLVETQLPHCFYHIVRDFSPAPTE